MNFLRSSPFSSFLLAWALQLFIFFCCAVSSLSSPPFVLRHLLMKALRSSPFSSFLLAWALQDFMRSCCAVGCLSFDFSFSCAVAPNARPNAAAIATMARNTIVS